MDIKDGIALSGYKSLAWIFESEKAKNQKCLIKDLRSRYLNEVGLPGLVNPGLLLMASYIMLVYPKEASLIQSFNDLDISHFEFRKGEIKSNKDLVRRLRNSISHANLEIINGDEIKFIDSFNKNNSVEITIKMSQFAYFLENLKELHFIEIKKRNV